MDNPHPYYDEMIYQLQEMRDLVVRIKEIEDVDAFWGANPKLVADSKSAYRQRLFRLSTSFTDSLKTVSDDYWHEGRDEYSAAFDSLFPSISQLDKLGIRKETTLPQEDKIEP